MIPPPFAEVNTQLKDIQRHLAVVLSDNLTGICLPVPHRAQAAREADQVAQRLRGMGGTSGSTAPSTCSMYLAYELLLASAS